MSRIVFIEKVFLKAATPEPLRGVELFNVRLLRDLSEAGYTVVLPVHRTWQTTMRQELGPPVGSVTSSVQIMPLRGGALLGSLNAALVLAARLTRDSIVAFFVRARAARGRTQSQLTADTTGDHTGDHAGDTTGPGSAGDGAPTSTVLVGNVGDSLIPALRVLRRALPKSCARFVLLAHRMPSARFLRSQRRVFDCVVSVNRVITETFQRHGFRECDTYYGVTGEERYFPRDVKGGGSPIDQSAESGATVQRGDVATPFQLVVLGQLDNAWKGADTAVAAYRLLPPALQAVTRLHLIGYGTYRPCFEEEGIIGYRWMSRDEVAGFLRTMDVQLVPSRDEDEMRETFSQAMVQGMLSGLPTIVSDLPVLREKLEAGGGKIACSIADFADAIRYYFEHPDERSHDGQIARTTALEQYVWRTDEFCRRYMNV